MNEKDIHFVVGMMNKEKLIMNFNRFIQKWTGVCLR